MLYDAAPPERTRLANSGMWYNEWLKIRQRRLKKVIGNNIVFPRHSHLCTLEDWTHSTTCPTGTCWWSPACRPHMPCLHHRCNGWHCQRHHRHSWSRHWSIPMCCGYHCWQAEWARRSAQLQIEKGECKWRQNPTLLPHILCTQEVVLCWSALIPMLNWQCLYGLTLNCIM